MLINGVSKTIENEAIEQKGGFRGMLLDTLGLLRNLLKVKGVKGSNILGRRVMHECEGKIIADQDFQCRLTFD